MAFNAMHNPQVLARATIPIFLNWTTLRIAMKDAAATVPEASPGQEERVPQGRCSCHLHLAGRYWRPRTGLATPLLRRHPPSRFLPVQKDKLLATIQLCLVPRTKLLQSNMRQLAIGNRRNISLVDCRDIAQHSPSIELKQGSLHCSVHHASGRSPISISIPSAPW